MMLFRNAARPIGLGFKTLSTPSTVTSSPRFLKVAVSTRCQTRLSSTASTLTPPWQVSDLSATEQRYYAEFGPDYINHVSDKKQRANIVRAREAREKAATHFQQQLGEDVSHPCKQTSASCCPHCRPWLVTCVRQAQILCISGPSLLRS